MKRLHFHPLLLLTLELLGLPILWIANSTYSLLYGPTFGLLPYTNKGVSTRTAVNSHLCVMIGASVVLSQSQHIGVSHYLPVWLRPKPCRKLRVALAIDIDHHVSGNLQSLQDSFRNESNGERGYSHCVHLKGKHPPSKGSTTTCRTLSFCNIAFASLCEILGSLYHVCLAPLRSYINGYKF